MNAIKLLFTVLGLAVALQLSAQSGEGQHTALSPGDIDKFLTTYKPMTKDFKGLEGKLKENGDLEEMQASLEETDDLSEWRILYDVPEVKAVLDKYGWDGEFYGKMQTIMMGLGVVQMEKEMNEQADELEADEKAMMQRMYDQYKERVDDASLSMIRAKADELMKFFEVDTE